MNPLSRFVSDPSDLGERNPLKSSCSSVSKSSAFSEHLSSVQPRSSSLYHRWYCMFCSFGKLSNCVENLTCHCVHVVAHYARTHLLDNDKLTLFVAERHFFRHAVVLSQKPLHIAMLREIRRCTQHHRVNRHRVTLLVTDLLFRCENRVRRELVGRLHGLNLFVG